MLDELVKSIDIFIEELNSVTSSDIELAEEKLSRVIDRILLLAKKISPEEFERCDNVKYTPYCYTDPQEKLINDSVERYKNYLVVLKEELLAHPNIILGINPPSEEAIYKKSASKKVFIVHGHDELNLLRLDNYLLRRHSLKSTILNQEAGHSRTIIEKLEKHTEKIDYAVILMTNDDHIQKEGVEYVQARPNVLIELGRLQATIGRDKICILLKKGCSLPSDLSGIQYHSFKETVRELFTDLDDELRDADII